MLNDFEEGSSLKIDGVDLIKTNGLSANGSVIDVNLEIKF
jgi:hypothetical protein